MTFARTRPRIGQCCSPDHVLSFLHRTEGIIHTVSRYAVHISEANQRVTARVQGPSGESTQSFAAPFRLDEALELLKQFNHLPLADGRSLYQVAMIKHYSLLAVEQQRLFDREFAQWTKYRDLLAWLQSCEWPKVTCDETVSPELQHVLRRAACLPPNPVGRAKQILLFLILRDMAWMWVLATRILKKTVAVYSPDLISDLQLAVDARMSKAYQHLNSRRVRWAEMLHLSRLSPVSTWKARRRLVFYFETFFAFLIPRSLRRSVASADISHIDVCYQSLMQSILAELPRLLANARSQTWVCYLALRLAGSRLLVSIDDFRVNTPLLLACRFAGIRTCLIQHGTFTRYFVGWTGGGIPKDVLPQPTIFLVISEFWRRVLNETAPHLGRFARVVSGWDTDELTLSPSATGHSTDGKIRVLLPFETSWNPQEAAPLLAALAQDPSIEIIFKVRPDWDTERQWRQYFSEKPANLSIVKTFHEISRPVDCIIGSHTSLLFKMIPWKKPIFAIPSTFTFGDLLTTEGFADLLPTSPYEALQRIKGAHLVPTDILAGRAARYRDESHAAPYQDVFDEQLRLARVLD